MASRYPEIKKYILKKIDIGEYVEDIMLPTEKEFTELFQVSRMTVRRALDELIHDGILVRKRGSGVFLTKKKIERSLSKISISHDEDINKIFDKLSVKIIAFTIVRDHYIAKKYLGLSEDEEVYQIKRVQLGDNQPIVYENIFLPVKYFSKIEKEECKQSMNDIVNSHMIINNVNKKNNIIVEAKSATKSISSLLQVPLKTPILQISIVVCGEDGNKLYCGINSYSGDDFIYTNH